jgi:protein SCO1/2
MTKSRKAGLLIVTLVIPALIFTFLQFFANNHYDLPYYHPLAAPNGSVVNEKGDTVYHQFSKLALEQDSAGDVIRENLIGQVTVVSYLPEECQDTCQLVLSQLERIKGLRKQIPYLSILTLAENGAESAVKSNGDGWRVLTAKHESLEECLDELRFQTVIPKGRVGSFESKLVLLDKKGFIRGYYEGSDATEIDRLMAEIKILHYEEKIKKGL